jgi:beta-galactosidase
MTSRRDFLATLSAVGAGATLPVHAKVAQDSNVAPTGVSTTRLSLETDWSFRLDPLGSHDPEHVLSDAANWQDVTVPHTWQTLGRSPEYVGVAWYRRNIDAPAEWSESFVRVEFEGIFHTAHVFLNGTPVGEHVGKGYTAFAIDLSPRLRCGHVNTLLIRVDNSFSDTMLPRMKSYDWANDGGIVRPVSLLITPPVFVERLEIDAIPDLERKTADVEIRIIMRNTLSTPRNARVRALVQEESGTSSRSASQPIVVPIAANGTAVGVIPIIHLVSPKLWHFDSPHLYSALVTLEMGHSAHCTAGTFGIRRFEARGTRFYLNGEPVLLMGVERMAGSHPELGMAESTVWIEANHRDMKELNCVFTRVHWAQDRRVLEYCDRNGILIQEEVPAWGPSTFDKVSDELQHQLEENGLQQLREMIMLDRNHPSIVSWGLCNEVDGKNPRSRAFAHAISVEARRLDPSRLQTYASHTLGENPGADMAGDFDFISTNEYYGSWHPGGPKDVSDHIDRIRRAFPDKPIVVSEYGWCECQPTMPAGDDRRVDIVNGHTEVFRNFPEVAGAIYFDYNDYRTLVGDKGIGALQQRVHGVVDLYANRKPSFQALRLQSSPIESLRLESDASGYTLRVTSRKTLPTYTLRGYRVRWIVYGYDDLPMDGRFDELPVMTPGVSVTLNAQFSQGSPMRVLVDILRPTGHSVATAEARKS